MLRPTSASRACLPSAAARWWTERRYFRRSTHLQPQVMLNDIRTLALDQNAGPRAVR
jgi:hypothetical protein